MKKNNPDRLLNILERLEKRQEIVTQALTRIEGWQKTQEVKTAFVTSATPLSFEQKKELKANLGFLSGTNFLIETRVDPKIIAGLKIQIDTQVIDTTIASQLEKLKVELKKLS